MTLEFVTEAKKVLRISWSARFGMLAAVLQMLAEFQEQLPGIREFVPHGVFSLLAILCAIAVPLSRIVKQQKLIDAIASAAPDDPAPVMADAPPPQTIATVVNATVAVPPPPPVQPITAPRVVNVVVEHRPPPKQFMVIK